MPINTPLTEFARGRTTPVASGTVDREALNADLKYIDDQTFKWEELLANIKKEDLSSTISAASLFQTTRLQAIDAMNSAYRASVAGQAVDAQQMATRQRATEEFVDSLMGSAVGEVLALSREAGLNVANAERSSNVQKLLKSDKPEDGLQAARAVIRALDPVQVSKYMESAVTDPKITGNIANKYNALTLIEQELIIEANAVAQQLDAKFPNQDLGRQLVDDAWNNIQLAKAGGQASEKSPALPALWTLEEQAQYDQFKNVGIKEIEAQVEAKYGVNVKPALDAAKQVVTDMTSASFDPSAIRNATEVNDEQAKRIRANIDQLALDREATIEAANEAAMDPVTRAVSKARAVYGDGFDTFVQAMGFKGDARIQAEKAVRYLSSQPGSAKRLYSILNGPDGAASTPEQLRAALQGAGFSTSELKRTFTSRRTFNAGPSNVVTPRAEGDPTKVSGESTTPGIAPGVRAAPPEPAVSATSEEGQPAAVASTFTDGSLYTYRANPDGSFTIASAPPEESRRVGVQIQPGTAAHAAVSKFAPKPAQPEAPAAPGPKTPRELLMEQAKRREAEAEAAAARAKDIRGTVGFGSVK